MPQYADTPGIALQVSRGLVVASIQVDLDEDVLARFREDLLRRIHESDSRGAVLDLSGLETLDTAEFESLRKIVTMIGIMGAQPVLVGMKPGVVSGLIEAGADVDGLRTAIDLDAAYELFHEEPETPTEEEGEGDAAKADGEDPAVQAGADRGPDRPAGGGW